MRIACWQGAVRDTTDRSDLGWLRVVAARAAEEGARLLVTPEMSLTGYRLGRPAMRAAAALARQSLCAEAAGIAAEYGIALVVGWPEADGDQLHNTARLIDRGGHTLADYRKVHLFGEVDREVFTAGDRGIVQAAVDGLTVGLLICYDVEFPEAVRAHAVAGTELLLVPSALMRPWEFVADTLVPARAFESQLFLAYVNWVGQEHELSYCGLSQVVGPDGRMLAGLEEDAGLLVADLDRADLLRARATTTYLADRRPELYGELAVHRR